MSPEKHLNPEEGQPEKGQTVMEVLLLTVFVFIVISILADQMGPLMRTSFVQPMKDSVEDTIRFGVSDRTPIDSDRPEGTDRRHPYNSKRMKALHL